MKLKPCPFCGSKAKMDRTEGMDLYISCTNIKCGAMVGPDYNEDIVKMSKTWNRRSQDIGTKAQATNKRYVTARKVWCEWLEYREEFHGESFPVWLQERLNASQST